MEDAMQEVVLKRFEKPDEIRTFEKGKFELVRIGGMTIGRATYKPGWRWSEHVGKSLGEKECMVEHVGMVLSGCATAAMSYGRVIELHAGEMFYIPPWARFLGRGQPAVRVASFFPVHPITRSVSDPLVLPFSLFSLISKRGQPDWSAPFFCSRLARVTQPMESRGRPPEVELELWKFISFPVSGRQSLLISGA
jgi:quercetin dioxygenase-like cupin family protein